MLTLTDVFRRNMIDTFHATGAAWLEKLPETLREFEARWSLQTQEPFLLSFSYCAPALRSDGAEVVLKLTVPCVDFTQQVQALRYYNGRGMVQILDADPARGALLMERLRPGRMLIDEVQDDELATRIAAQVMPSIWVPAPPGHLFPDMSDWANEFKLILVKFKDQPCPLPARTIQRTLTLFAELLASPGEQVLLHGDLHHFNILSVDGPAGPGWRAIDPFGVVGDREVEVGAFMGNANLNLPIDPPLQRTLSRRLDIFHEHLGFDRQRLAAWASVYSAVSAWWTLSSDADGWQFAAALSDFLEGEIA